MKSAPILLPAEALLMSFQEAVAPVLAQIDTLSMTIENLRTTRDLLLPRLISGEIPVEAANDAAAQLMEEIAQPA